jgi:Rhs element Vgr protein
MTIIKQMENAVNTLVDSRPSNHYHLTIDGQPPTTTLSVLSISGREDLNQPWRYEINFTCTDKQIPVDAILRQSASLTFQTPHIAEQLTKISSLEKPQPPRTLYGVITEFSLLSINKDEAHYQVVLQPRLALFANDQYCAIYQNQSVVSVVEAVLRQHGFTGVDYRLELKDEYPAREFITQWHESDLAFIQRLLSDVGIWFYFESHHDHHCDVLVLSDNEQGYDDAGHIVFKAPSGMVDGKQNSIWNLQFSSSIQPQSVMTKDYNYRTASADQHSSLNTQPKDVTTAGIDYRYGEHHKDKGDNTQIESGQWYSKIRHEAHLSQKWIIRGECNDYHLIPGQHIIIDNCEIGGLEQGIIILSTESYADRSASYQCHFTAIAYDVLKPYRPIPLSWPQVSGTLPARVTSPDNDTYGYIDTQGRYRVKFDFDLKSWKKGEESLWVRLAKPYAGDRYGFHFPLIDGTEVAIAFTEGNPDRPYIAHAMHDSAHPDHVATANKHRNVIRTPANNKLRMDDKRGQEHIKLATEYGKTQLNLGHLVNQRKEQRGEGFELRTDEWGAIRAGKGLYMTTYKRESDEGVNKASLDADDTVLLLEQGLSVSQRLSARSDSHRAGKLEQQKLMEEKIKQLNDAALLHYAPAGVATVTPDSIQHTAGENIIHTAQNSVDISAFKRFMINAGNRISLFASKMGITIFAAQGKVDIQAQNDELHLTGNKHVTLTSVNHEVTVSASKKLNLVCGNSAIVIQPDGIKLISPGDAKALTASFNVIGPSNFKASVPELPAGASCEEQL